MNYLLSIPPSAVESTPELEGLQGPEWFLDSDPDGERLGSGGGSAHLLLSAWQNSGTNQDFTTWLRSSQKLMVHGGGRSRRLPAYASCGKLFTPMPVWRWSTGQHVDQNLFDLQRPYLERIFAAAPESSRLMIASGDVLVKFSSKLPTLPDADVICIGLWGNPSDAQHFGVFFCNRQDPKKLAFFRQKPSRSEIQQLVGKNIFLLDAGIWMLSERAVKALLALGQCDTTKAYAPKNPPRPFELYSDFGLGLGENPAKKDEVLNSLTVAVIPVDDGEFYHFGRSSDLIKSSLRLQNLVLNQHQQHLIGVKRHPDLFVQNACVDLKWTEKHHRIWVENSHIGSNWELTTDHVLTGIPKNDWALELPSETCLDMVPVDDDGNNLAVRVYGMNDDFKGPVGDDSTHWLGNAVSSWFTARGFSMAAAGIESGVDIQQAPLFPVLSRQTINPDFIQWLLTPEVDDQGNETFRKHYCESTRLSAAELSDKTNLRCLYAQRREFLCNNLKTMAENHQNSVFYRTDLKHLASLYAANESLSLPPELKTAENPLMKVVHDRMFRAETLRKKGKNNWGKWEDEAFALLRQAVLAPVVEQKVVPRCNIAPDQIVWARCPARLDLAGGWTDTPPYCQLHGGKVVNLAVNLNGQPPLQTFIRRCDAPHIVLRSIDLGSQTVLKSYEDLADYAQVGNEFSIGKAALALAGFHPKFNGDRFPSLQKQLEDFGSGLEISFVVAIPKGSGLGTSSILAATILGALSDFCSLEWSVSEACSRTLALEQMLTSGGGWQDQFGAALHGVKLLETDPGVIQSPRVKWLPDQMLKDAFNDGRILLYYTGITRIAKGILQDIVRGMFLNSKPHLSLLEELGRHAEDTYEKILRADWPGFCRAVDRSWRLNQQLDADTNSTEIQQILDRIQQWTAGAKLLGAGGGGYLMICAKDANAAIAIQNELNGTPPNSQARFVTPELSTSGLQVTRS